MTERIFRKCGKWALGADAAQWILYKQVKERRNADQIGWHGISFVSSDREILARCMVEKGCEASTAIILLEGLPNTYREWKASVGAS
jgi:hypothetical protein